MSEPASLYARLTLDPERHAALLQSPVTPPAAYDDWRSWLGKQPLHGGAPSDHELQSRLPASTSFGALLDAWHADPSRGAPRVTRDAQGRCQIVLLLATENYLELVHLLAPLRGAATVSRPDADDFILVTSFLWDPDSEAMACLALADGGSHFVDVVPVAWRDEAFSAFEAALDILQAASTD